MPKLLDDLVAVVLFVVALLSGAMLIMGHSAGGALAFSGLLLVLVGFAIRNVIADPLSGEALGLKVPFRIDDWMDIDGLARGRGDRECVEILRASLTSAPLINQIAAPDLRIQPIDADGIRYALRYWLDPLGYEIDCRGAIWREVDAALDRSGASVPTRSI